MRIVILLILATLFGYGLLQVGRLDPDNYVKMYLGNYVVEVKVLSFLLLLLLSVLVLYFIIRLIRMIWKAPGNYAKWLNRHEVRSADALLGSGYLSLIKGDWRRAEKDLTSKSDRGSLPYINYLAAAQAAQEQGKSKARDEYLNAAYKAAPKERLAIGLIKARLHQNAGQLDQALLTLNDISSEGAKNAQYTAMLVQTHQQMKSWGKAQALLPIARKQKALPEDTLDSIANEIHSLSLNEATDKVAAWKALPRNQKKRVDNIRSYAAHLACSGNMSDAEKLIRDGLNTSHNDELVHLYGTLDSDKPGKLRRRVEGWLMARPENSELNLAAGRLAAAEKNYDLAKEYLQKAISIDQLPLAFSVLGEVYEASNDSGKALKLYRAGMVALSKGDEQRALGVVSAQSSSTDEAKSGLAAEGELVAVDSDVKT